MKVGEYIRTPFGIRKIANIQKDEGYGKPRVKVLVLDRHLNTNSKFDYEFYTNERVIKKAKHSFNIIDLIEYMDLLELEHPIKLYGSDTTIGLFNPVRCDGFTEFEDGTHCIILNMDYIVDVKDLIIKSILTHEEYDERKYKPGE